MHTNKLIEHHTLTTGKILSCDGGGRGHPKTIFIKYNYYASGKYLEGEIGDKMFTSLNKFNSSFVGKYFPIIYNTQDESQSAILISPDDFKALSLPFPDSLKWVCDFIEE